MAAAVTLAASGCQPENVRQEKALRRQLAHEMHHRSYATAVPIARQLLKIQPQDNALWKRLMQSQIGLHDLEGAKQTLVEWRERVQLVPAVADEYEGDIARQERDPERALQAWRRVVAAQRRNRGVLEKIARLEQSRQNWMDAQIAWSASLEIKDDAAARINRAACRRRLREWNGAFADLHRAQQLAPNDPEVQSLSKLFERLGKLVDEITELDLQLQAAPEDASLLTDRALLLLRGGDPELAQDDSEAAHKLAPWAMRPILFQAIALIALNRAAECEALSVRQPLRLEALAPEFLETMSRIDSDIAVERTNGEHFIARSWQLNEIGQPTLALQDAENAARLDSKSPGAWTEVGYSLMKLGREQEAFEKVKKATELDSNFATAWQYRGELEMTRGDYLNAIDSLSHALGIRQTASALQKREECYRRAGLNARADEDHRALQQMTASTLK
jgi:tetratricopeptide (TPR) repeat protein